MKITTLKYILIIGILAFLVACSTKKNTFLSRKSHALSTKYNILYNGGIALDKGIADLKLRYKDNFWETLPVERMQVTETQLSQDENRNEDFDRAEEKATKAIQKHSMNIDGGEKNSQIDEAHLMLGKARYYSQRFVPALEAFNYVLYKYPNSDKIYEVKIWREKTNMRMDNDAAAITNLRKLLKEIKFKDQIFADANATLAQAFLNLKENDSAIAKLKLATEFTKQSEEKARYRFILGQIYDQVGYKDSAFASYQKIIDMKRKSSRRYIIQAHAEQAKQFDYKNGDTIAFLKKYRTLLKDRENRPFLDVLNHQVALFYDKSKKQDIAKKYYNKSLRANSEDQYLVASNYRNLAEIYFNKARYVTAGKYFDSTLVSLKPRTREFNLITKKRFNLEDVIKFEGIAQRNDSIIKIASMSSFDREKYYQDYIDKLKIEDEINRKKAEAVLKLQEQSQANDDDNGVKAAFASKNLASEDAISDVKAAKIGPTPTPLGSPTASTFYFYNPTTVSYGKIEFKKKWGNRSLVENWRLTKDKSKIEDDNNDTSVAEGNDNKTKEINPLYTTDFYIKNIPTDSKILDSLAKERNFAYYQLGVIYKEKFKEYQRAADKLETLLANNPEERLVLPAMYNLYKIYEIIDKDKALAMKSKIVSQFPDSRYAQIITNPNDSNQTTSSPDVAYNSLYKEYESGLYRESLVKVETDIEQFTGEEILPKFELLKANLIGKLKGLEEYKKALNYVALTYPNSDEGKQTEVFISEKMSYLESLSFNSETPNSWKVVFPINFPEDKNVKILVDKITKFTNERTVEKLTFSNDVYNLDKNFIVIHGIKSKESAVGIAQVLKDYKEYKIADVSYIISNENYKVVQIKKNSEDYLTGDWLNKEIIPVEKNITISISTDGNKPKLTTKDEVKNALNNAQPKVKHQDNNSPQQVKQQSKNESPANNPKNSTPSKPSISPPSMNANPKR